jgi:hypothetical protein
MLRRHRSKLPAVAGVLAVAGLGVFVGSSIGSGAVEPASSIDVTRTASQTVKPGDLRRIGPEKLGLAAARGSKKSAKLFYYVTQETFTVQPGARDLRELRCPKRQEPATGGVLSPTPGLAITNSSRSNPDGPTLGGAWYEAVTNFTSVPLGWQVHLTCVGR